MVSLYQGNTWLASLRVTAVSGSTGFGPNDGTLHFGKDAAGAVFAYQIGTPFSPNGPVTPLAFVT